MMPTSCSVVVASTTTIVPAVARPPRIHYLSNMAILNSDKEIDLFHAVWYYVARADSRLTLVEYAESLKCSLAKLLVHYPWLAGRAMFSEEDERPYVVSNDAGIEFVEAHAEVATLDEWLRWAAGDPSMEKVLVPYGKDLLVSDCTCTPIFMVQLTGFQCGGVSIGISASELVGDGMSHFHLMKAWSEVHQGLQISSPLRFAGHLLKARSPPAVTHPPTRDYTAYLADGGSEDDDEQHGQAECIIVTNAFHLSSDQVDDLVRSVEQGPFAYGKATSFEATAALMWQCITEARDLAHDSITRYCYPINVRSILDPPLPKGYFGNAIHFSSPQATARNIRNNHISYAAKLIHDDKAAVSSEFVKSLIDWVEGVFQKGMHLQYTVDAFSGTDCYTTYLLNFPIYEVNLGHGLPSHFSMVIDKVYGDGVVFITPTACGGRSRQIQVALQEHAMKRLHQMNLFRRLHGDELASYSAN